MLADKLILAPYYWTLRLRHRLYDKGVLCSAEAPVPTIVIGNIAVGGTGKTPHTEMLLRLLGSLPGWENASPAVLSRGYRRKTEGFLEVTAGGSAEAFGDEPLQIKNKFPQITVAVDEDRLDGCFRLASPQEGDAFPPADIVVLDDAFQHRRLRPSLSILLVDWSRPVFRDHLLPLGRLRDLPERVAAADIVIVTKCPSAPAPEQRKQWAADLRLRPEQKLFFTEIRYCDFQPVFPECDSHYLYAPSAVLFTGIANDKPLKQFLSGRYTLEKHLKYPDHHSFGASDISEIASVADSCPKAVLITTEKDAQRIRECCNLPDSITKRLFMAPIEAEFVDEEQKREFLSVLSAHLEESRPEYGRIPRG